MKRQFEVNERYRPIVIIKKIKNDIPTVLQISGRRYVLEHENNWKGNKK